MLLSLFKISSILLIIIIISWGTLSQSILSEAETWGVGSAGSIEHPRALLYNGAWLLAEKYFPFGSGFGTFAGAGAEKFDITLYKSLGFENYWWFGTEDYLMDTYWPNPISETGVFGAAALLISFIILLAYSVKRCVKDYSSAKGYWAAAAGLMVYMLLLSFSSPSFQDLRLFIFPAIMFGVASKLSQDQRSANTSLLIHTSD